MEAGADRLVRFKVREPATQGVKVSHYRLIEISEH